ncbi:MAG TPA: division/cell wall cluster transcriptional repressor MraZ [Rubricoccaceae bacterium]
MAGFKGQAEYSVDGKGRVPVPAKMRRSVNPDTRDVFVATRGLEPCVFLYPADGWEKIEAQMDTLNMFDAEARHFVRTINMWADEITLDGQGRAALPKSLLEFAGIQPGSKALIIGSYDHIEIWDPAQFETYLNGQTTSYDVLAQAVMAGRS